MAGLILESVYHKKVRNEGESMERKMKNKDSIFKLKTFFSRGIIVYLALAIALILIFSALLAPVLTPYDPYQAELSKSFASPDSEHLLGCDYYGRDLLTRLLYGARISLICSVLACLAGGIVGMLLGLIAGYYEGPLGMLIMRYVDVQMSIPPMIFTICISLISGGGVVGVIVALGFGLIPSFARMMYGLVLQLKGNDYIVAARLVGTKNWKIVLKHLLPNTFPSMIVLYTANLGGTIMLESTLSFLGIGIKIPMASWGNMVSEGYTYIFKYPLVAVMPGLCIVLVVIAFNILGDAMRDSLDPRLRGKL